MGNTENKRLKKQLTKSQGLVVQKKRANISIIIESEEEEKEGSRGKKKLNKLGLKWFPQLG